jgi:hypothetical protein
VVTARAPGLRHAVKKDGPTLPSPMPSCTRDYGCAAPGAPTGCEVMRPSRLHGGKRAWALNSGLARTPRPWTGWGVRPNEDGVGLVRAVKPCAFGAPLHGFGALTARPTPRRRGRRSNQGADRHASPVPKSGSPRPDDHRRGGSRAAVTLDRGPPHVRGASIDPPGYDAGKSAPRRRASPMEEGSIRRVVDCSGS